MQRYDPDLFPINDDSFEDLDQGLLGGNGANHPNPNQNHHPQNYYPDNEELFNVLDLGLNELRNQVNTPVIRPLNVDIPRLPEQPPQEPPQEPQHNVQQIVRMERRDAGRNLFNNMPSFMLGGIQSLRGRIQFSGLLVNNFAIMDRAQICFRRLRDQVLMVLSTKTGTRTHLRMVFNDVDIQLNQDIRSKARLSRAERSYFELLRIYGQQVMNAAKQQLRDAVWNSMERRWVHMHCQNRGFESQIQLRRQILQKYMNHFREQLFLNGHIMPSIISQNVLRIPLFQQQ